MTLVFPSLPGLTWNVVKAPTFQTRIQRAVSGRESRTLDYPYPLWQFTLVFEFLRDNPAAGYDELRTLMGFFMLAQGAFGSFLFQDPTDYTVTGAPAWATISGAMPAADGTGYVVGDALTVTGGSVPANGSPCTLTVSSIGVAGAITGLTVAGPGQYTQLPPDVAAVAGGSGSGGSANLTGSNVVQLARPFGTANAGGFLEPIIAPNAVSAVYINGIAQTGWILGNNGLVTLPAAPTATQAVTADLTYYFLCRFIDDRYDFNNFMFRLWELKKLTFISVRP